MPAPEHPLAAQVCCCKVGLVYHASSYTADLDLPLPHPPHCCRERRTASLPTHASTPGAASAEYKHQAGRHTTKSGRDRAAQVQLYCAVPISPPPFGSAATHSLCAPTYTMYNNIYPALSVEGPHGPTPPYSWLATAFRPPKATVAAPQVPSAADQGAGCLRTPAHLPADRAMRAGLSITGNIVARQGKDACWGPRGPSALSSMVGRRLACGQ